MPVHPDIAARFPMLAGLTSARSAYATDAGRQRIRAFESWEPVVGPAIVDVLEDAAPGPHGPVPVRVYGRTSGPARAGLVWLHGGALILGNRNSVRATSAYCATPTLSAAVLRRWISSHG